MRLSITSEMAVTPSAWCTVAGRRAEGKVLESKRERRQWTSGLLGRRVEKGVKRVKRTVAATSESTQLPLSSSSPGCSEAQPNNK